MTIPLQWSQSKQQEVKWQVHTTELVITESEPERSSPELSNLVLSRTPGCQGRRKWISLVSHTSRYSIWWYGGTQTTRHCYKTTLQEILVVTVSEELMVQIRQNFMKILLWARRWALYFPVCCLFSAGAEQGSLGTVSLPSQPQALSAVTQTIFNKHAV